MCTLDFDNQSHASDIKPKEKKNTTQDHVGAGGTVFQNPWHFTRHRLISQLKKYPLLWFGN